VKRELHALILALLGGTLLKLAITGDYSRYVKVGVRPYLVIASVVVLLVAGFTLWQAARHRHAPHTDHHDDEHGHDHGRVDVAWLLVVPMLVLLIIAPPALGSYSASRSGTALGAAQTSDLPPLPDGDPVHLSVLDYASRAVFDHGKSIGTRHVTLSGFVLPADGGSWYLTRMVITCCAADAQPIKVGLTGTVPATLKANDWIQVTGTYTARQDKDPVNAQAIPYLTVESSQPIPAPALQYES
jgi:uncharacterized repeat protein (TIGR03943 family)